MATKRTSKKRRKQSAGKKAARIILTIVLVLLIAGGGFLGILTLLEYRPKDTAQLSVEGDPSEVLQEGGTFRIMTWNIGYGALGSNADFFMDGGSMVMTADEERLQQNLDGILAAIREEDPDVLFLQEVDRDSGRSHHVDEKSYFQEALEGYYSTYACNYKALFVPYPWPPIGMVDAGIMTFTTWPVRYAERIQLPVPFSWPVRTVNLKRCLDVERIPVEGSEKELVLVNLHLEAYDDGEGKAEQTKMLRDLLQEEAEKGNYVIAGGDLNQTFSNVDSSRYPTLEDRWQPGIIDTSEFGNGWQFIMDTAVPSCRSLDQPYDGADTENFQYYLIDGFIVSDNIAVDECRAKDLRFENSDHEPVLMTVRLL